MTIYLLRRASAYPEIFLQIWRADIHCCPPPLCLRHCQWSLMSDCVPSWCRIVDVLRAGLQEVRHWLAAVPRRTNRLSPLQRDDLQVRRSQRKTRRSQQTTSRWSLPQMSRWNTLSAFMMSSAQLRPDNAPITRDKSDKNFVLHFVFCEGIRFILILRHCDYFVVISTHVKAYKFIQLTGGLYCVLL